MSTRAAYALPAAYGEAAAVAARIAAALAPWRAAPLPQRPARRATSSARTSHGRLMIVDWEYAGMGHPCFDLGNLSVNNDFDEADDERLLSAYHGVAALRRAPRRARS